MSIKRTLKTAPADNRQHLSPILNSIVLTVTLLSLRLWSDKCDQLVTPVIKRLKDYKICVKRDHIFYPISFHSSTN